MLQIERLPLDQPQLTSALKLKSPIAIVLAPSLTLERKVFLPDAASRHAENAISLELRQSLPSQAQGLVWSVQEGKRSNGKVEYLVHIVKEASILQLLHDLRLQGVAVETVFAGRPGGTPVWNVAAKQRVSSRAWFLLGVLVVAAIALTEVSRIRQGIWETELIVTTRQARVDELELRLTDASRSEEEAKERQQSLELDASRFALESQRLEVLTDLGKLLPDTVWVSELTIANGRMSFAGFARSDVAEIVALLQDAPWAASVELEGSITNDAYSEQSRFMIAIDLKPLGIDQ